MLFAISEIALTPTQIVYHPDVKMPKSFISINGPDQICSAYNCTHADEISSNCWHFGNLRIYRIQWQDDYNYITNISMIWCYHYFASGVLSNGWGRQKEYQSTKSNAKAAFIQWLKNICGSPGSSSQPVHTTDESCQINDFWFFILTYMESAECNTARPERSSRRYFAVGIFKRIFLKKKFNIDIRRKILVQVTTISCYLKLCWPISMVAYGLAGPDLVQVKT